MKNKATYHSSITRKFVSKEYAKENPETTVEITSCNLREELVLFSEYVNEWIRSKEDHYKFVDNYLNQK